MKTRKKPNRNDWKRVWLIGRWDKAENKIQYMRVDYSNHPDWLDDMQRCSYLSTACKANKTVESNELKTWNKTIKNLVPHEYRKRYQLFVCKVFRNEYDKEYKLTKQTAFHLMEVVANNI